ncbi:hypothetical protein [Carnobacterium maltaromaticum]|uniref:hypothetical protein n=1 Tax=Carnobacterium maltaromaticum TaxID=2751 RepID=UPI00165CE788|nr:hypothetical protein [Carnobacterium maltaromaticum]MBC9788602.1 hypothetical protein [Carnobacterium maltaromaticum]
MPEKNYTHKIVMFDVNSAKRVAYFKSLENARRTDLETLKIVGEVPMFLVLRDDKNVLFNLCNIVQINPVEVIESD